MAIANIGFRTGSWTRRSRPAGAVGRCRGLTSLTSMEPVAAGTYVETRRHVRTDHDSLDFLQTELVVQPILLPRTRSLHSEHWNPLDGKSRRTRAGPAVAGTGRSPAAGGSAAVAAGHCIATRTLRHGHFREAAGTCRMAVARHR